METNINEQITMEIKESIKLLKMSKGYNWEIKIIPLGGAILSQEALERLRMIDNDLRKTYGVMAVQNEH